MKKLAVIGIALILTLSLAGCRDMNTGDRTNGDMDPARGDVTSSGNGADGTGVIGTGPNDPHDGDQMGSGNTSHSGGTDRTSGTQSHSGTGTGTGTQSTSGTQTTSGSRSQSASGSRTGGMG